MTYNCDPVVRDNRSTFRNPQSRVFMLLALSLVLLVSWGCSQPVSGNENGGNDNGSNSSNDNGAGDSILSTDTPAGFPTATRVSFEDVDRVIVDGEIVDPDDVVVYNLGPLSLGDRIEVLCIARTGSNLDPMAALFDADGFRVFWNDDINPATGNFDAAFDGPIRHDSNSYVLAVATTTFFDTTGKFRCTLQLERGVAVAPIIGQTIVLRLTASASVTVAGIDYGDLPTFDAASIDTAFAGDTAALQAQILDIVREDYAPFDVTISTTDDDAPKGNFSTLFFGVGSTQAIFGIADKVDFFNSDDMDGAIVFLEAFAGLDPSLEATAQAIANVVSHEIGHTLGLMHTNDVTTLMDTTGVDTTLLVDQSFGTADIVDFPIGKQNASLLLEETVGRAMAGAKQYEGDGLWRCGTCGAKLSLITGTETATTE